MTDKDILRAWDILGAYLLDNVPLPGNWEDHYPELDEARFLINEHLRNRGIM